MLWGENMLLIPKNYVMSIKRVDTHNNIMVMRKFSSKWVRQQLTIKTIAKFRK